MDNFYYPKFRITRANHYVKDNDVAEDLVQDVFISLLESDYKFKTENDIKYFLYSSLKNKCISHSRKQKVRDKYYQDVVSSLNEEEHFWDKVLEEDVYARLMAAIETLPPQCKLVMIMTLDGLKASEIAERLHISVDTVKDHKSNGKKKLTAQLKDAELLCLIGFLWL
ncbi:RNA polymerase sigma factor [Butyricimonas virosa]|uniref:RNA polymerase sigma factor n=1 Tax=Butyricimonas virosa TaxID=544645 RepID=UPI003AAE99C9